MGEKRLEYDPTKYIGAMDGEEQRAIVHEALLLLSAMLTVLREIRDGSGHEG